MKRAAIQNNGLKNQVAGGRGRPKKDFEKISYTWTCSCGNKQVVYIRCIDIRCSCGKYMKPPSKESEVVNPYNRSDKKRIIG